MLAVCDRAIHREFDNRLRFIDGVDLPGITGIFDDFERLAICIHDGIVGSLNPDFFAAFANTLVFIDLKFAAVQVFPELFVVRASGVVRFDKHAVMLAFDFIERVAECIQKILVGGHDGAIHLKFDNGLRFIQSRELSFDFFASR